MIIDRWDAGASVILVIVLIASRTYPELRTIAHTGWQRGVWFGLGEITTHPNS